MVFSVIVVELLVKSLGVRNNAGGSDWICDRRQTKWGADENSWTLSGPTSVLQQIGSWQKLCENLKWIPMTSNPCSIFQGLAVSSSQCPWNLSNGSIASLIETCLVRMISSLQSLHHLKLASVTQGTSLSQEIHQLGEEPRTYESNKVMDFGHCHTHVQCSNRESTSA